jgi:hypothetical protein
MRRGGDVGACVTGAAGAESSLDGAVTAGAALGGDDTAGPSATGGSVPGAGAAAAGGAVGFNGKGALAAPVCAGDTVGAAGEDCAADPWACRAALAARHAAPIHQPRMSDSALPAARLCAEDGRMMSNPAAACQSWPPARVRNEQCVAGTVDATAKEMPSMALGDSEPRLRHRAGHR